jgi:ribonuclease VapC
VIVDTSALMAVIVREPGHEAIIDLLADAGTVAGIGAPTAAELGLVLSARLRTDARPVIGGLLERFEIEIIEFTDEHWRAGVDAFLRYGRGRHKAALNFGDCLSYAVASLAQEPLLFVGDDFGLTDQESALDRTDGLS